MICSAIVPRFERDQVLSTDEQLDAYDDILIKAVVTFVCENMQLKGIGEDDDDEDDSDDSDTSSHSSKYGSDKQ